MTTKGMEQNEKQKKKYRSIFENALTAMFRSRIDGTEVLEVSQPLCDILGYTREEILAKPATMLWADQRVREKLVNQLLKDGIVRNYEAELAAKGGTIKICLMSLKLYPQEGHIEGIAIDITEEKQAKEQLFTTLESIVDGFFSCDKDWRFIYINSEAERIFGINRFEVLGLNRWDVFPQTLGTQLEIEYHKAATGEIRDFEYFHAPLARSFHIRCYPRQGGGISVHLGDITERKQVEEELRKSEAKYRFLTENINDILWTADLDFNITYESNSLGKVLGYDPKERLGQEATKYMTTESRDKALGVLHMELTRDRDKGVNPERDVKVELEYFHRNGSIVWLESIVSILRDDAGNIAGFYGVSRDITERKHAENALKESENRFRSLIQKSLDMIIILDREEAVAYESPSIESILGYPPGYHIGDSPLDLIHPDDLEIVSNGLKQVYLKTNSGIPVEFRFKKADNTWVHLEAVGQNLLDDPAINGVVITAREITERKRAENSSRSLEEKFSKAFHLSPNPMAIISMKDLKYIDINESSLKYSGYSYEEHIGHTPFDQEIFDKELISSSLYLLREKGGFRDMEFSFYSKKGEFHVGLLSATTIEINNEPCILTVTQIITERKLAEEELKKHRDHLEELVKDRTGELSKAYEKLKQENEVRRTTEVELVKRSKELEEMNSALRVLLKQREDDKTNLEDNILANIKVSVMPYVEKIESSGLKEDQREFLSMIKFHLMGITSPFVKKLSSQLLGLTPNELQVASMIREGKRSKDIAELMKISLNTVHTFRYHIRTKIGLKNNKVNLRTYLQTLE